MEDNKKISVIVVSYNSLDHIDTCISSVLNQTYTDFEVIFVDNNSTDNSLSYAMTKYPDLIFVSNTENLGYAGGVCTGLAQASGKFIAPLNIDTEVTADWLYHLDSFLDENPRVAAVTPKILLFDDRNKINALGSIIHISGLAFCRKLYNQDSDSNEPQKVNGLSGCSYLIRRDVMEQINRAVGWWDLDLFYLCYHLVESVYVDGLASVSTSRKTPLKELAHLARGAGQYHDLDIVKGRVCL